MTEKKLPHRHNEDVDKERKVLEHLPDMKECAEVADIFKLISDGTRLRILWLLCHCEECVSNIAAATDMSDPAVSHHLRVLRKSGLLISHREGKEVYYKLADSEQAVLVHHAIEEMFKITCPCERI